MFTDIFLIREHPSILLNLFDILCCAPLPGRVGSHVGT